MRYHSENYNRAYGDFKFGPLFMRLCYELGLEDFAANTIKDMVSLLFYVVQTVNGKEEEFDCATMLILYKNKFAWMNPFSFLITFLYRN